MGVNVLSPEFCDKFSNNQLKMRAVLFHLQVFPKIVPICVAVVEELRFYCFRPRFSQSDKWLLIYDTRTEGS